MTLSPAFIDTTPTGPSAAVASVYRLRVVQVRPNRGRVHIVWAYRMMLSIGGAPPKRVLISRARYEAALLAGATRGPDDIERATKKAAQYVDALRPMRMRIIEHG